jgi:HEAT repeat protein
LLYEALQDPSPYVTRAAVSALGKTPNPLAVPILLEQLRQASRGQSEIPIRSAKAALNRHANDRLQDFLPFLESEEVPFRLLVVDSIREMLKAKPSIIENFPPDLYDWFIHRARFDLSSDVRARSAGVIGCFRDANSIKALRALLLDENEYVRLHAARACGHPFYVEMVDSLVECMTDQRWRVRESAAKALASVGSAGAQRLADFFLATSDHYAKEQIADELQRSGLILQLVPMLGSSDPSADKAEAVCSKMVGMGMTSLFKYLLPRETSVTVRDKLLEILATGPDHPKRAGLPALPADAEDSSKDKTTPFLGTPVPTTTISTGR